MIATPRPPSTRGRPVDLAYTRRPGLETRRRPAMLRSRLGPYLSCPVSAYRAPFLVGVMSCCGLLPAALGHAGQFARVCHLAQADPAQPELAVNRVRAAALVAAGVGAHRELRLALALIDQCLFRHL